jgi:signal transduction histidine kinase
MRKTLCGVSAHSQILRLTKRRIALIQLRQSLNVLEHGDPVSALTLAGAAEEILGRAAIRKGKEPRVEYLADCQGSFLKWAGKGTKSKKELIGLENRIRNTLKHQDDGRNVTVEADFMFEAENMLLRCMFNHFKAYGCYPQNKRLRRWFENMSL